MFQTKLVKKNQNTHFMFQKIFFYPENRDVYEIISKNMVVPEGTQMTSQYRAYELHAG